MKQLLSFIFIAGMVILFPPLILVFLLEIGGLQKKREKKIEDRKYQEIQFYARMNEKNKKKGSL